MRRCAACEVNADKCYFALGKQDPKKGWVKGKDGWQFTGEYLCGAPSCQKMGGHGTASRAKVKAELALPTVAKSTVAKSPIVSANKGKAAPGSMAAATEAALLAVKTGVEAAAAEAAAEAAEAAAAAAEGTPGLLTAAAKLRQNATKLASKDTSQRATAAARLEDAKVAARAAAKLDAAKAAARVAAPTSSQEGGDAASTVDRAKALPTVSSRGMAICSTASTTSAVGATACSSTPVAARARPPTDEEVRAAVQKSMEQEAAAQARVVAHRAAMNAVGCVHPEALSCNRCRPDPTKFCQTCGRVLQLCEGHLGAGRVLRKRQREDA